MLVSVNLMWVYQNLLNINCTSELILLSKSCVLPRSTWIEGYYSSPQKYTLHVTLLDQEVIVDDLACISQSWAPGIIRGFFLQRNR